MLDDLICVRIQVDVMLLLVEYSCLNSLNANIIDCTVIIGSTPFAIPHSAGYPYAQFNAG